MFTVADWLCMYVYFPYYIYIYYCLRTPTRGEQHFAIFVGTCHCALIRPGSIPHVQDHTAFYPFFFPDLRRQKKCTDTRKIVVVACFTFFASNSLVGIAVDNTVFALGIGSHRVCRKEPQSISPLFI
jgi:hypothetical protein